MGSEGRAGCWYLALLINGHLRLGGIQQEDDGPLRTDLLRPVTRFGDIVLRAEDARAGGLPGRLDGAEVDGWDVEEGHGEKRTCRRHRQHRCRHPSFGWKDVGKSVWRKGSKERTKHRLEVSKRMHPSIRQGQKIIRDFCLIVGLRVSWAGSAFY